MERRWVSFGQLSFVQMKTVQTAIDCVSRAYAPYSGFPVGAAVATNDGAVFGGCNVENASYGLSICAERVAIGNLYVNDAVPATEGGRTEPRRITCVAVYAPCVRRRNPDDVFCYPCGACRQVLVEHATPDAELILIGADTNAEQACPTDHALYCRFHVESLTALLPFGFTGEQLPLKDSQEETAFR
ncbi:hypothetical protein CCYA_CCYA14G3720 [Cyanidiococcus yangmingshanensis]|uniref:CMP/dCMP-type deaminase domain-containing protein n=1 Tax=Cyanidiococcus yangmingshanensis TaxID=2690220 RepID=A0A7J7IGX0_9RHOD|nr:hypothetical protein F1559_002903 [Cyanidiococcus yangmingshanensis]KAK4532863.1 hypothetical protein CCYA_CCYA14G3720 [Cyanidiococcus yangmingshanensis]